MRQAEGEGGLVAPVADAAGDRGLARVGRRDQSGHRHGGGGPAVGALLGQVDPGVGVAVGAGQRLAHLRVGIGVGVAQRRAHLGVGVAVGGGHRGGDAAGDRPLQLADVDRVGGRRARRHVGDLPLAAGGPDRDLPG